MGNWMFNGVDATTGEYLLTDWRSEQVSSLARGERMSRDALNTLKARRDSDRAHLGMVFGPDADDLAQAGWGVVFAEHASEDVCAALDPLLRHRELQAGARYRVYSGAAGYRENDTVREWLGREPRKKALGPADPARVPFYLLLVGDPEDIPFRFQFELDVNYAVGRICFNCTDDYRAYAQAVVAAEGGAQDPGASRRAVFFGARNDDDGATELSADQLVDPLFAEIAAKHAGIWNVERVVGASATKARLGALLSAKRPPSILFTATHGMGFRCGHPMQATRQGALLCQDWPGPIAHHGPIPPEFYFSADDLPEDVDTKGMILFAFACYGGGTPCWDEYVQAKEGREQIAPRAFVAELPRRLLSLRGGAALAVVAHVERVWSCSFVSPDAGTDFSIYSSAMNALMHGQRLGNAMDVFGMKCASAAFDLNRELEDIREGARVDDFLLAMLWTMMCDARSFVIVGDPAVRVV